MFIVSEILDDERLKESEAFSSVDVSAYITFCQEKRIEMQTEANDLHVTT